MYLPFPRLTEVEVEDVIPPPQIVVQALETNPCKTTALPPINGPLKYAQSMLQSNTMTMMMMAAANSGVKVNSASGGHHGTIQKLTRRDITDQRIIQNIINYNSPQA